MDPVLEMPQEHRLVAGDYEAVVTAVGGGVRSLRHQGRDLVLPYGPGEVRPRYRGALLAPWPNRVVDGRYSFRDSPYQLDLSEPERGHAMHGLAAWARFSLVDAEPARVRAVHRLVPRTGYPFEIEVSADFGLGQQGLTCTVGAVNHGPRPAPYGVGFHPYLLAGAAGPHAVDSWSLELPAGQVLHTTEDRLIPTERVEVADGPLDFGEGRRIGDLQVDHAFTALSADADGLVRARVRSEDGTGAQCTWNPTMLPWAQVHTADVPAPEVTRAGLAVEPMSCPPDAFNSGVDLTVLLPGESTQVWWTIGAT